MKTFDLIKKRVSVRTFTDQEVDQTSRQALIDYAATLKAPWGHQARFAWVPVTSSDREAQKFGTYGMIVGAGWFLAGAMKKGPGAAEDFGYLFEGIVLKATEMGLGTCWLGGTFNRADFIAALNLRDDEFIPAVCPVGYASTTKRLKEKLIGAVLQVRQRKPLKDLVVVSGELGIYRDALEAVRLGPSASNKQPWRIHLAGAAHFYLEETPGYNTESVARCGFPIQSLDMGIAFSHWERVLADQGLVGAWTQNDPKVAVPGKWVYVATWSR
jgi:nitroreductase